MPEIKISEMTEAVTLTDEDLVPIVQGDLNKKANVKQLRQYNNLHDRPTINNVVLEGEKNLEDLKLIKAGSGIETATDNSLKLEEITENDIKTRNSVKGNRAVSLNKIDITASNTAHQDMSDSYNANTNPLLIQGEKQPVSYKATKNYIDTKNQEIMQHIADEKTELTNYINEEDLKVKEHTNTLNQNTDNKFTELTNVLREDVDTLITDVDNIEQTILKDREENQEKFFTGKISIPMDSYSGPTSLYGVNVEKIEGNYEQKTINGYQLFDASKLPSKTQGGATVTNNGDGSFTVSGSGNLTSNYSINLYKTTHEEFVRLVKSKELNLILKGDYVYPFFSFSLQDKNTNKNIVEVKYSNLMTTIKQEYLDNPNIIIVCTFYGASGNAIVPGVVKPMVWQDGDGTFEPFTGGMPSPSPEYPQEIKSVEITKFNSHTNQLFDASKLPTKSQGGATVTNNNDGSFTISGSGKATEYFNVDSGDMTDLYKEILKPGLLKIGNEKTIPSQYINFTYLKDDEDIFFQINKDNPQKEITEEMIDNLIRFTYGFVAAKGTIITPGTIKPMLYQDGDGTWEPFKLETTTLSKPLILKALPNGIRDTYENGIITRRVGEVVFDGSNDENWTTSNTKNGFTRFIAYTPLFDIFDKMLCDRLKVLESIPVNYTEEGIIQYADSNIRIILSSSKASNAQELRPWLQSNNLKVYYELATPVTEQFSIPTLPSFYPFSVINHNSIIKPEQIIWAINTKINASYLKNEVYNRVEMDNELSKMARSGDIIPLGAEIRIGEDDLVPEEYELVEEIYNAEEVVMNNGITVESAITELQTSGLRIADPSPIGTQIVYEGPANMIPSNYKVVEPAFSNPNLLINGDFQVNQRHNLANGKDFNNGYVMDRWVLSSNNKICTVKATIKENDISFVRVTAKEATGLITLLNPLELSEKLIQLVKERKLTLSMMIRASKKSAYHYKANEIIEIGTEWKVVECEYSFDEYFVDPGVPRLNVYVGIKDIDILTNPTAQLNAGDYFDISWAKLELGELATPFIPRSYGEELLLCQRYYERQFVTTDTYNKSTGETNLYMLQGFSPKTEKRAMPTITITDRGGNVGYCTRGKTDKQPVRVYLGYGINNFEIISDDGVGAGQIMAWVTMDAEIY